MFSCFVVALFSHEGFGGTVLSYLGNFSKENVAIVLLLSLDTYERNSLWGDEIKLLEGGIEKSPNKFRPLYNPGVTFQESGWYEEAIKSYKRAIKVRGNRIQINAIATLFQSVDAAIYNNTGGAHYWPLSIIPPLLTIAVQAIHKKIPTLRFCFEGRDNRING
jgi:tetratricopeptide (TPR) repeat protein